MWNNGGTPKGGQNVLKFQDFKLFSKHGKRTTSTNSNLAPEDRAAAFTVSNICYVSMLVRERKTAGGTHTQISAFDCSSV